MQQKSKLDKKDKKIDRSPSSHVLFFHDAVNYKFIP